LWNGINYSTSGTYTFRTTNAAGCDSVAILVLRINSMTTSTKKDTTCNVPYLWNGNSYSASGVYTKVFVGGNSVGCDSIAYLDLTIDCPCNGFKTYTQGGWGSCPNGNNPGSYLNYPGRFNAVFPQGLTIGCQGGNKLKLTSAQAVTNFLPSGTTARALPFGVLVNPTRNSYRNVFAGQLIALTLNVKFDSAISNFASSYLNLKDLYIVQGIFMGWTVNQLLNEANKKIGGCSTNSYSYSQFNDALNKVNNAYDGCSIRNDYLSCYRPIMHACKKENNNFTEDSKLNMSLAPNPAKYETTLSLEGKIGQVAYISIIDLSGKLLKMETFNLNSNGINYHILNVSKYENQMIIIKVSSGNKTSTRQLIVSH
jgi:hypothetical protein